MSLILDALRKMELERKANRQSSTEIRADVLNYRGNPQATEKSRLLPVIVALLFFSSATAFFLYFKEAGVPRAEPVKASAPVIVDDPARSGVTQTTPLPLPQAQLPSSGINRSVDKVAPTAITEETRQPSGGDSKIAVSGIAWQEERSLRRAVINGALVSEGAEVSGAKVVEIRENLVRFSRNGQKFEVIYRSGSGR